MYNPTEFSDGHLTMLMDISIVLVNNTITLVVDDAFELFELEVYSSLFVNRSTTIKRHTLSVTQSTQLRVAGSELVNIRLSKPNRNRRILETYN